MLYYTMLDYVTMLDFTILYCTMFYHIMLYLCGERSSCSVPAVDAGIPGALGYRPLSARWVLEPPPAFVITECNTRSYNKVMIELL